MILGLLFVVVGVLALVYPHRTFVEVAAIFAFFLGIKGFFDMMVAFMSRARDRPLVGDAAGRCGRDPARLLGGGELRPRGGAAGRLGRRRSACARRQRTSSLPRGCTTLRRDSAASRPPDAQATPSESPSARARLQRAAPAARAAGRRGCSRRGATSFGVSGWNSDARYWMCPRPGPELELAAAVGADAALGEVVVGVAAAPRTLPKRDGFTFTIRGGNGSASMSAIEWIGASQVKRSLCGSSTGRGLVGEARVLEPGVGERLRHAPVEVGVGRLVHDRALVEALEVDRVDRAGLDQLGDQLVGPVAASGRA